MTSNSKISIAQQPGNKVCAAVLATYTSIKSSGLKSKILLLIEVRLLRPREGDKPTFEAEKTSAGDKLSPQVGESNSLIKNIFSRVLLP
jgi:hypothetical protein